MLNPLYPNIVLKLIEEENKVGKIYLSSPQQKELRTGKVVAMYEGCTSVRIGSKVLYKAFAGQDIKHEGEDLIIIDEEDMVAKVR